MAQERLDPADVSTWLTRGRTPEHAAAIAAAWRDFPDLPPDAPLQDRTARGRERIAADVATQLAPQSKRQEVKRQLLEHEIEEASELVERIAGCIDLPLIPTHRRPVEQTRGQRGLRREVVVEAGRAQVAGVRERLDGRAAVAVLLEDGRGELEQLDAPAIEGAAPVRVQRPPRFTSVHAAMVRYGQGAP